MNTDQLAALRERVRDEHPQIRVCCPRGHFLVTVALYVFDANGPIRMMPRFPANVQQKRQRHPLGLLPSGEHRSAWWHEYAADGTHAAVRADCRKCGYAGEFDANRLAIELAVRALAGHPEHRLVS